jgi:hypothetical protein
VGTCPGAPGTKPRARGGGGGENRITLGRVTFGECGARTRKSHCVIGLCLSKSSTLTKTQTADAGHVAQTPVLIAQSSHASRAHPVVAVVTGELGLAQISHTRRPSLSSIGCTNAPSRLHASDHRVRLRTMGFSGGVNAPVLTQRADSSEINGGSAPTSSAQGFSKMIRQSSQFSVKTVISKRSDMTGTLSER